MNEKQSAVKSTIWAGVEQYTSQGIQFITGIVMARLLMPDDFGIIAMLFIFLDISTIVSDMGFTTSLIRKQNCNHTDYCTVFYSNVGIAVVLYIIFVLCSSFIAEFYAQPLLQKIIPVIGVTFIINALYATSATQLTKALKFNTRARITFIESILSATIGIYLAYIGLGIWAIAIQIVCKSTIKLLLYSLFVKWMPSFVFSTRALKNLSSFGVKVLGANLLFSLYQNIYGVLIGKHLSPSALGYYSRADGYSKLVPINISTVLMKTMLPIISKIQDNDKKLTTVNKQVVIATSFVIFPISMLLAGAASPIISVVLTNKWLPCVPILQILCFAVMIEHIAWINWDFILAKGKSGIVFKNRVIICAFSVVALCMAIKHGIIWVAIAKLISTIFTVSISILYTNKVLPIKFGQIFMELAIMFVLSITVGGVVYYSFMYLPHTLINLIWVGGVSALLYLLMSKILLRKQLQFILTLLKKNKNEKTNC